MLLMKLPFKTAPKKLESFTVGNPEIGELEIPRLLDLSPNERIFIRDNTKNYPDLRTSAVKMARAIATKSGQKLVDVYNSLTAGDTEALGDYLEEFVEFQDLMERVTAHRRLVMATAILRYRLQPEWELENTGDSNQIHPKLVAAIADFAQKEESGWIEPKPVQEEDLEGKQNQSKSQIGQISTGVAPDTGRQTKDLAVSGSASNPPF